MTKRVFVQMAQWIGIRMSDRLYKRLRFGTVPSESKRRKNEPTPEEVQKYWETWCTLYNDILHTEKVHRTLRSITNQDGVRHWRAFLGRSYRIIPNDKLFFFAYERIQEAGAEVWHARLSEDNFMMYAVAEGISEQVTEDRTFDPGDGWQSRWHGEEGDVCNAAVTLKNSDTGQSGLAVCPAVLRKVCQNYCVWQDVLSKRHVGEQHDMDTLLTQETIDEKNKVLFMEIGDYIKGSFDEERFGKMMSQINEATQDEIKDPIAAAEGLRIKFDITDKRKKEILNRLFSAKDTSRYGLIQAITEEAHKGERIGADEGFELEQLGSKLLGTTAAELVKAGLEEIERKDKDKEEEPEPVGVGADDLGL
jgi:hypothetical protein